MSDSDFHVSAGPGIDGVTPILRVTELWRYPVKSLLGERLSTLDFVADGVEGDRMWGVRDQHDGRILTARREPRLLFASSRIDVGNLPLITLPDGRELSGPGAATDRALSRWLGKPVALVGAAESDASRAEYFADATDDASQAIEWTMPQGRFVDAFAVLIMTTAGLRGAGSAYSAGSWEVRRFRPNVLIEVAGQGWLEDAWADRCLRAGSARLVPRRRCIRCTMVNRAQPGLDRDVNIYRTLSRTHGGEAGMWTQVIQPGSVSEGDLVEVTEAVP
jgi:uncharacterized protein YcbX